MSYHLLSTSYDIGQAADSSSLLNKIRITFNLLISGSDRYKTTIRIETRKKLHNKEKVRLNYQIHLCDHCVPLCVGVSAFTPKILSSH